MKSLIPLMLLACSVLPLCAEAAVVPPPPVNTICPMSGDPVDINAGVVTVKVELPDKTVIDVTIGVCCGNCLGDIPANPQLYGTAALANKESGKSKINQDAK
jgi:hypothetical protein